MMTCNDSETVTLKKIGFLEIHLLNPFVLNLCTGLDLLWVWKIPLSVLGISGWNCFANSQQYRAWPDWNESVARGRLCTGGKTFEVNISRHWRLNVKTFFETFSVGLIDITLEIKLIESLISCECASSQVCLCTLWFLILHGNYVTFFDYVTIFRCVSRD